MEIKVQDRLPAGLKLEIVTEFKAMAETLIEEGIDELVQPFYERTLKEKHPELEGQSWEAWEGYYCDQKDGTQNLYVVGVLHDRGLWYPRLMRVKQVPRAHQTEVEQGMAEMMHEYMKKLLEEIARTIKPGSGKADPWPRGLN